VLVGSLRISGDFTPHSKNEEVKVPAAARRKGFRMEEIRAVFNPGWSIGILPPCWLPSPHEPAYF
jgi:hypothetical protein